MEGHSWHQDSDLRAEMTATEETWGKQQAMAAGGDSQLLPFLPRVKLPRHPRSKTKQKHRDAPIQINKSTLNYSRVDFPADFSGVTSSFTWFKYLFRKYFFSFCKIRKN